MEKNRGITLIALVITIIILLILAGISITTLTGENGLLIKTSKAERETDIVNTKEQIKLEIMGNFDEKSTNYTNQDVIKAVDKITGVTVDENEPMVQTQKGNAVDISDLWVAKGKTIHFTVNGTSYSCVAGTTWRKFLQTTSCENLAVWDKSNSDSPEVIVFGSLFYYGAAMRLRL